MRGLSVKCLKNLDELKNLKISFIPLPSNDMIILANLKIRFARNFGQMHTIFEGDYVTKTNETPENILVEH